MSDDRSNREHLSSLIGGFRLSQCIYVVADLKVSEALVNGPLEISKLAKITNTNVDALYRILRYLCSFGIFQEVSDQMFSTTKLSDLLRSDHEYSLRPMAILSGKEFYQATALLSYSVSTGKPAFNKVFKQDFWHYLFENDQASLSFNQAMEKGSYLIIQQLLDCYDFSESKIIVDVGGGKGHVVSEILSKYKNIEAIVFDLPQVKKDYELYINSRCLTERCRFIAGDFFVEKKLPKADIYILKTILHDWGDEEALSILKLCSRSMGKSDTLLIVDRVINRSSKVHQNAYMWDIQMLAIHGGLERSLKSFKSLINKAKLEISNITQFNTELYLLEIKTKE